MKSSRWVALGVVFGLTAVVGGWARAAEDAAGQGAKAAAAEADQVAAPDAGQPAQPEPEYAFGTVKSVNGDQLVINEFDDSGQEKEAIYLLDDKTQYENVASAQEIAAGDEVDIDYLMKDDKKVAVTVSVAKPVEGEETGR